MRIFTIGHSTRSVDEFVELLREHDIGRVVDVRRFPSSRRHPHFAAEAMGRWLAEVRVDYVHEGDLGGYRRARQDSLHTAWRVAGFRAYADHMNTPEFRAALDRVIRWAKASPTAVMCAEATPWRCHRQLISDALVVRGFEVVHILAPGKAETHTLNPHARLLEGGRLLYAAPPADQRRLL